MQMGLSDKVILITGAASGIGLAVARQAVEDGAKTLVLTDRDAAGCMALSEEFGDICTTVVTDLTDPAAPATILNSVKTRFGRVDILVNAAGLTTRASVLSGTAEVWDELFAVNAKAAFFLMQDAIADMKSRGASGAIVNILSMNVHCGAPDLAIYSGTKGAMATLTRNAAHSHMADRIRVNGINLGWVATPAEHRMQAEILGRGPGWLAEEAARMPLGRLVAAEEAARLAVFLMGEASVPMSGSIVDFEQRVAGAF